jgi:hypothetical protein
MDQRKLDLHFKVFSLAQALIILVGAFAAVQGNLYLGWSWFFFFLSVAAIAPLFLYTYFLYRYHKWSAVWAIIVWALQTLNIESDVYSWTLSFGLTLTVSIDLGEALIMVNLIALLMLFWVTWLTLKQRELSGNRAEGPMPPAIPPA